MKILKASLSRYDFVDEIISLMLYYYLFWHMVVFPCRCVVKNLKKQKQSLIYFVVFFQENLLLDEDQNLKLIDFGLCAKPKVGWRSIQSSCLYLSKFLPYHVGMKLTHYSVVTPYVDINIGQHWLRWWLLAWRHQAITWINVDVSSAGIAWLCTFSLLAHLNSKRHIKLSFFFFIT